MFSLKENILQIMREFECETHIVLLIGLQVVYMVQMCLVDAMTNKIIITNVKTIR